MGFIPYISGIIIGRFCTECWFFIVYSSGELKSNYRLFALQGIMRYVDKKGDSDVFVFVFAHA